jgi:hypothetical protein
MAQQGLGARRNRSAGGEYVVDKANHTGNRHSRPNRKSTIEISSSLMTSQGGLRRGITGADKEVPTNTRLFSWEKCLGEKSRLIQTTLPMTFEMKGHRYDDLAIGKLVEPELGKDFNYGRQYRGVTMIFESSQEQGDAGVHSAPGNGPG